MDIDTGESPAVSQRPHTLPLKHHECIKSEIETLEDTGVIRKSFSLRSQVKGHGLAGFGSAN